VPFISDEEAQAHYQERYAVHAQAMGYAMREARALMDAGAAQGLSTEEVANTIAAVMDAMRIAQYHTDRMKVYDNLSSKRKG
jgi:hypothetical protein